jgi:hypothetical protein
MSTRTKPLRSSAGRNSRKRPPLEPAQVHRAQVFCRRVMNGTAKIVGRDHLPAPVAHHSGPQYWSVGTFIDDDLEYTVQVLVTRRRDTANSHLLP